ncbi:MAG: zinc ribbon domain-containing protein [Vicinamibacterales bacterium]
MNADLERLIELQRLDSIMLDAQRRVAEEPDRLRALDARLDASRQQVTVAKDGLSQSQASRRDIEKELAVHQGRLSKYRDQLMAVKTNIEYQAMQKEIAFAQTGVKSLEDRILERMLEADELTAALKTAEAELVATQKEIEADKKALSADVATLRKVIEETSAQRQSLVAGLDPKVLSMFQQVASRRNGVAVAEARDGICTICHVRIRPQVFNTVRRNVDIIQCDSCQRILYFVPAAPSPVPTAG